MIDYVTKKKIQIIKDKKNVVNNFLNIYLIIICLLYIMYQ